MRHACVGVSHAAESGIGMHLQDIEADLTVLVHLQQPLRISFPVSGGVAIVEEEDLSPLLA